MKKILIFWLIPIIFYAQQETGVYLKKEFIQNGDTLRYRILYPLNFNSTKNYPLVVFLHGSGERGKDNEKQLVHGASLFQSARSLQQYPAIVIFPQCPEKDYWANVNIDRETHPLTISFPADAPPTKALSLLISLIETFQKEKFIDKNKIYVGGLSMGGMGTYEILARRPNIFAAAFVICGGGNTDLATNYAKTVPLWIFHGAKDDVVDPNLSLQMSAKLLSLGAFPNLSLYAQDNHNSWDSAFKEPNLLPWLFSNSKYN